MRNSRQLRRFFLSGLTIVLVAVAVLLYVKTEVSKSTDYSKSLVLLRHMKQLNSEWELGILKQGIGLDTQSQPLADPFSELKGLGDQLDAAETSRTGDQSSAWIPSRDAYLKAIREKAKLVDQFGLHNAVLQYTLNSLSIAEDRLLIPLTKVKGGDRYELTRIAGDVYETVLSTMEYAHMASNDRADEVESGLGRLAADKRWLSSDIQGAVDILVLHVRTVLREQPMVNALMNGIAAVPVAARLDDISDVLSREQLQADVKNQRSRLYMLIVLAVLAVSLLYMANRLIRSYAEINRVNRALQAVNDGLEERVQERTNELQEAQSTLVATARQAGMAEIATNVLHNVGNVLNSVNISADLVNRKVRTSKAQGLARAVRLINEHAADLGDFMTRDEKGKLLPGYLNQLVEALDLEQQSILDEIGNLIKSVDHIKEIVLTQQSYAGVTRILEPLQITDVIDDALRMQSVALLRHEVTVVKEYGDIPILFLDKNRLLLILVNLISNAKYAMSKLIDRSGEVTLSVDIVDKDNLRIRVKDVGEGIAPENLTRMFAHGFTTRKEGHGFGLHSCALAAMEMGGALTAFSDGPGKGAVFTLQIPFQVP